MRKYTKEQLLFYLKKLSNELQKTPTLKDMNKNKKYPSGNTYFKRFESWNNSLKGAGLKINVRQYNKTELIENLKILAKELGRIPRPKDLKGKKWASSYSTYRKYFRYWKGGIREAGITKTGTANLKVFAKKK